METLPVAYTASEPQIVVAEALVRSGREVEPGTGEFCGRTGAEWVLWRALRSQSRRLVHGSALLFDEPAIEAAATL